MLFRSLRLRLLLLITIVLVVTGGLAATFASRAITERFEAYVIYRESAGLERRDNLREMMPSILSTFYARNQREGIAPWEGVEMMVGRIGLLADERLVLYDLDGNVLVDTVADEGHPLPTTETGAWTTVETETGPVGRLQIAPIPAEETNASENAYVTSVNRSLLWAMLAAGLIAAVMTLFIAQRIIGPLEALTAAARRMAGGDLGQRVTVHASDEIGELAQAFNSMADSLTRIEQLRRNMVSDVAHELRTPLSNIRGYLEALQDGVVRPSPATIDLLYEEAMLLHRVIEDLQQLALAEARQLRLACQPVAIEDLINHAVAIFQHRVNGIRLSVQIEPDLPPLNVDAERIGQVLRNLLDNAFAYAGEHGEVRVSAIQCAPNRVRVCVYNTGTGISPEHLPNLFERFYRVDTSRSRATGGSGLGLAIVRQLIEAHGGQVWAESEEGNYAAFYFTLPSPSAPRVETLTRQTVPLPGDIA